MLQPGLKIRYTVNFCVFGSRFIEKHFLPNSVLGFIHCWNAFCVNLLFLKSCLFKFLVVDLNDLIIPSVRILMYNLLDNNSCVLCFCFFGILTALLMGLAAIDFENWSVFFVPLIISVFNSELLLTSGIIAFIAFLVANLSPVLSNGVNLYLTTKSLLLDSLFYLIKVVEDSWNVWIIVQMA